MRDHNRTRHDLSHEVIALRKQVADLKEAMVARRRVEDALRRGEEQLRALADSVPTGLCLLREDGAPMAANRPLASRLGYDSPTEMVSYSATLGIFGCENQLGRILAVLAEGAGKIEEVIFRAKDGSRISLDIVAARPVGSDRIAIAVLPTNGSAIP